MVTTTTTVLTGARDEFGAGEIARISGPLESVPAYAREALCVVIGPGSEQIPEAQRASFRRVLIVRSYAPACGEFEMLACVADVHLQLLVPPTPDEACDLRPLLDTLDLLLARARARPIGHA